MSTGKEKVAAVYAAMVASEKGGGKKNRYTPEYKQQCMEMIEFCLAWIAKNSWYKGADYIRSLKSSCEDWGGLTDPQYDALVKKCNMVLGRS